MNIEVRHVRVFRLLLALVGLLDQRVEAIRVGLPRQNTLKLLLMQLRELLNRLPECFEKLPRDIAIGQRTGGDSKKLRLWTVKTQLCSSFHVEASTPGTSSNPSSPVQPNRWNISFRLNHLAVSSQNCPNAPCYGFRRG
jgi:hypothetical protein